MPIIITREGPVEPKETRPLTQDEKQALWGHVVNNWCQMHPDQLQELLKPEPVKA